MGVYSAYLFKKAKELFEAREDKRFLIEDSVDKLKGKCPHCHQKWPSFDQKEKVSMRINGESHLDKVDKPSVFLAVALSVELGICPLCGQKHKK
jgi:hypothetical protein